MEENCIPRTLVIGGTCSGVGKTSLATEIITVLRCSSPSPQALDVTSWCTIVLYMRDSLFALPLQETRSECSGI